MLWFPSAPRPGARACAVVASVFTFFAAVGCDGNHSQNAKKNEIDPDRPAIVAVEGGSTVVGFANGPLQERLETPSFEIAQSPVTRAAYARCVDAEKCPALPCAHLDDDADDTAGKQPVDCASVDGAQKFCAWVGGRLPELSEWLRAARGDQPRRFAWGDTDPTCEQHPWAGASLAARSGFVDAMKGRGAPRCAIAPESLTVRKHKKGASPSGMEDVLLSPAEMVVADQLGSLGACTADSPACVVYGLYAGSMDSVTALGADVSAPADGASFRCVWRQ